MLDDSGRRDFSALPGDIQITTKMLWQGALLFALIDAICMPVLAWRVSVELFRQVKWVLVIVAGVIWLGIWSWAIGNYWETVYVYVFPGWGQAWIPPAFGFLMAMVAFGLWALAQRFRMPPVIGYCLLGGLWGVLTHIIAVYRGIVTKPPMLQGASPVAAVTVAFFEFMFYWCVILSLSVFTHGGWTSLRKKKG